MGKTIVVEVMARSDRLVHSRFTYLQSSDQVINNSATDLVYISLPISLHKEFNLRATKAGKHVIVEKPMKLFIIPEEPFYFPGGHAR